VSDGSGQVIDRYLFGTGLVPRKQKYFNSPTIGDNIALKYITVLPSWSLRFTMHPLEGSSLMIVRTQGLVVVGKHLRLTGWLIKLLGLILGGQDLLVA